MFIIEEVEVLNERKRGWGRLHLLEEKSQEILVKRQKPEAMARSQIMLVQNYKKILKNCF